MTGRHSALSYAHDTSSISASILLAASLSVTCLPDHRGTVMIKHSRLLLLSLLGLLATSAAHAEQFSVLLFSKTAGWHHESILEGVRAIRNLGQLHDFTVFWTEDANRVFND